LLSTVATSVFAAISIALIFAAFKSRWLYLIAPKLYLNTPISDGQIVSLTLFNAGLLSEEDIAISMRPGCKFELIATSKSTLAVKGKTISVPKLARLETITILILVEGKSFDPSDIESVESKATKGKVIEKKEHANSAWQTILILPILLMGLVLPFVFGMSVGVTSRVTPWQYISEKLEVIGPSVQLAGFKTTIREIHADKPLAGAMKDSRISLEVLEVIRRGDVLNIELSLSNMSKVTLMTEGYIRGAAATSGTVDFWDSRFKEFGIAPNEKKRVRMKAYLPDSESVKLLDTRVSFESLTGDSLRASVLLEFK
jgi:hypothetical protein